MEQRKLPTGVQTFREMREENCYYVDKTQYLAKLVAVGKHYFLSRPRRFGKSLLLDTLKELFEANEHLFQGLAIHDAWDWSVRHPVVRLSFAAGSFGEPEQLPADFADQLTEIESATGVASPYATAHRRFAGIIRALHEQTGQRVVVLVDEYDRPIVDALDDAEVAKKNRSFLRGVYGVVKDYDAMIRFSFFTGVTKFSKTSIFSDLNNLTDITLDPVSQRSAATPRTIRTPCSRPSSKAWTAAPSATGTTATVGSAKTSCTTLSASCSCSRPAASGPTGSSPARRPSCRTRCSNER